MKRKTIFHMLCVATIAAVCLFCVPLTAGAAEEGIALDARNFPDAAFRSQLAKDVDTDKNGILDDYEIAAVTWFVVGESSRIKDLTGIEYFTELERLG